MNTGIFILIYHYSMTIYLLQFRRNFVVVILHQLTF